MEHARSLNESFPLNATVQASRSRYTYAEYEKMDYSLNRTEADVIEQLEARLQRIEYVTSGHLDRSIRGDDNRSAITRLRDLEQNLCHLVSKSRVIQDLLKLHAQHPNLFIVSEQWEAPPYLGTASSLSTVMAAASSVHQTASRLMSVNDTPLPTAEASTQLIDAAIGAVKVEVSQESQSREIATLKQRTTAVLQRWYSVDILEVGDCWADLEARVESAEQAARRANSVKQREEAISR